MVLDVGRPRRRRRTPRTACGPSTASSRSARPGPGRRGTTSGSGAWSRRPTRRRDAARGRPRASPARESATNGTAPNAVNASRRSPSPNGRYCASACTSGTATPGRPRRRRACRSIPADRSKATGCAPWPTSQREHIAAPHPTSSTPRPATSTEQCASASRRFSGHQTKSAVAEELAVLGLVRVGVGVPPAAVGAHRRHGVGRASGDADRVELRLMLGHRSDAATSATTSSATTAAGWPPHRTRGANRSSRRSTCRPTRHPTSRACIRPRPRRVAARTMKTTRAIVARPDESCVLWNLDSRVGVEHLWDVSAEHVASVLDKLS